MPETNNTESQYIDQYKKQNFKNVFDREQKNELYVTQLPNGNSESGLNISRKCDRKRMHKCVLSFYFYRRDMIFYFILVKGKLLTIVIPKKNRLFWSRSKLRKIDSWKSDQSKFDPYYWRMPNIMKKIFQRVYIRNALKFQKQVLVLMWRCICTHTRGCIQ